MFTDIELISKLDFFETLDQRILKKIAQMCIVREFTAGEHIVRQGEHGLGLYFITSGDARVEVERNGARVVVAKLKEGDFLGEFSLIDEGSRSANVICEQDTRCLLLTRDSFSKLLKKHPEIAMQMLRTMVRRIRSANERMLENPAAAKSPGRKSDPGGDPEPGNGRARWPVMGAVDEMTSAVSAVSQIRRPADAIRLYTSTKGRTQQTLEQMFGSVYAMKAMMKFSMAIVGCPVRTHVEGPQEDVMTAEWNGVKVLLFPAGREQTIRIEAYGDGPLQATIFRPAGSENDWTVDVMRLRGRVEAGQDYRVRVPGQGPLEIVGPLSARLLATPPRDLRQESLPAPPPSMRGPAGE